MISRVLLLMCIAATLGGCGGDPAPKTSAKTEGAHGEVADEHAGERHGAEEDHDESEGAEGRVKLSEEQIKTAGITILQAGPAVIRETVPVYGSIAPNAERVRSVVARFPGVVRSVNIKTGDEVKQGATLATVESNESLQTYSVVAPLNGVVIQRSANPGEHTGDQVMFTIADLSTVWVELSLFPREFAKVRLGQEVRVSSADVALSGEGRLVYLAPFGTSANQTLTARVQLDNRERRWAPGLYVTAEITLALTQVPLAVRVESLQSLDESTVVFVVNEEGFEARSVKIGRTDGQWVEVTEGLKESDRYAAEQSFILKAELGKGTAEHGH